MTSSLETKPLAPEYDAAVAELIRSNLRSYHLDIPGTAYYDEALDHLSAYYRQPGRAYFVLLENGVVVGGIGLAEFRGDCCELQKLYLADAVKGRGLGYELIRSVEEQARALGYRSIYLETHTNLAAAIHVYERSGYREIPRPAGVVHSTMNRFYRKELYDPGTADNGVTQNNLNRQKSDSLDQGGRQCISEQSSWSFAV